MVMFLVYQGQCATVQVDCSHELDVQHHRLAEETQGLSPPSLLTLTGFFVSVPTVHAERNGFPRATRNQNIRAGSNLASSDVESADKGNNDSGPEAVGASTAVG
jgi:hypothetical protein